MNTQIVETFAALGDPVRNAIVDTLVAGDATVGELAASFAITLQAVSQQISTLERAGLVTRHREGRTRRVHLELARMEQAATWMEARRRRLEERYQRLDAVLSDMLDAEIAHEPNPGANEIAPSQPRKERP